MNARCFYLFCFYAITCVTADHAEYQYYEDLTDADKVLYQEYQDISESPPFSSPPFRRREHNSKRKKNACDLPNQSPIDIRSTVKSPRRMVKHLSWEGYEKQIKGFKITNTGVGLDFRSKWLKDQRPYITDGPLGDEKYYYDKMYLHWGGPNQNGSHHLLNGVAYEMEIHFVHHSYGSLNRKKNTLYVTVLVQIGKWNIFLNEIIENLDKVQSKGMSYQTEQTKLLDILKPFTANFYVYTGTLTTPPCTANIRWLISNAIYSIGVDQIEALRNLKAMNPEMDTRSRPIQKLGNREVMFVYP